MRASKALLAGAALALASCGGAPSGDTAPPRPATAAEKAEAEAFLARNNTPLPAGWTFSTLGFGSGGFLRIGEAAPEDARATLLFVPGYTSSPELASDFIARWFDLGFEVFSVDLPGQGGSVRRADDPQKTFTGDFSVYGAAVAEAAAHVAARRRSEGPLIVAAESLGGHAALRAAADGGLADVDAIFAMVPAVLPETGAVPLPVAKAAARTAALLGRGDDYMPGQGPWRPGSFRPEDYRNCGDREDRNFKNTALFTLRPDLRVGGVSHAFALGMVRSGEDLLRAAVTRDVKTPVTMLVAGRDVIVRNDVAQHLCVHGLGACELVRVPGATHCLYLEDQPTQDQVHAALLALTERLESGRRGPF